MRPHSRPTISGGLTAYHSKKDQNTNSSAVMETKIDVTILERL